MPLFLLDDFLRQGSYLLKKIKCCKKVFFDNCNALIAQCHQQLGIILEIKVIQKLKLLKNVFYKKMWS